MYGVTAVALLAVPGKPGSLIGVNPSVGAWAISLAVSLAHVAVMAALAFRYLSVADEVPVAAPRSTQPARARRRR
jgi:hypothetical protein